MCALRVLFDAYACFVVVCCHSSIPLASDVHKAFLTSESAHVVAICGATLLRSIPAVFSRPVDFQSSISSKNHDCALLRSCAVRLLCCAPEVSINQIEKVIQMMSDMAVFYHTPTLLTSTTPVEPRSTAPRTSGMVWITLLWKP